MPKLGIEKRGSENFSIDLTLRKLRARLRLFGTTPEVSEGRIFQQEQIARAVQLGVGIQSVKNIQLIPLDTESEEFARRIEKTFQAE